MGMHEEHMMKSFSRCFLHNAMIPFILLHRTGFTRELVDTCTVFCRRGINFYNMESLILERRWEAYSKHLKYTEHCIQNVLTLMTFQILLSKSSSNDILANAFSLDFFSVSICIWGRWWVSLLVRASASTTPSRLPQILVTLEKILGRYLSMVDSLLS